MARPAKTPNHPQGLVARPRVLQCALRGIKAERRAAAFELIWLCLKAEIWLDQSVQVLFPARRVLVLPAMKGTVVGLLPLAFRRFMADHRLRARLYAKDMERAGVNLSRTCAALAYNILECMAL